MSWRTRPESFYRGLDSEAESWLAGFDRYWDTAASGRTQNDVMDFLIACQHDDEISLNIPLPKHPKEEPATTVGTQTDMEIERLSHLIVHVSVIRKYKNGFAIRAELKHGSFKTLRFRTLHEARRHSKMLREFMELATHLGESQSIDEDHESELEALSVTTGTHD